MKRNTFKLLALVVVLSALCVAAVAKDNSPVVCHNTNACTCTGINNCSFSCAEEGCKYTTNGTGNTTASCEKGKCTATNNGTGNCKITGCTKDCKVACHGTGDCSNTCTDPSCTTNQ